jgi:exopolysaccharide biosynthesis protein
MEFIVGGTPKLISDGKPIEDYSAERIRDDFVLSRHPRTAIGILPDGEWLFIVVDGRRPDHSIGMTLEELTDLLLQKGCREALNLDGGGSSTMYFNGEIRNIPSDPTGERPVSDAILILAR